VAQLPGLTGCSGDVDASGNCTPTFAAQTADLSAYRGQTILLAFRYILDSNTHGNGVWIDDVSVGGTSVSDGSSLEGWRTMTGVRPVRVSQYTVQLLGYDSDGEGAAFLNHWTLKTGPFDLTLDRQQLRQAVEGLHSDVVAVLVMADDPSEALDQYAPYQLTVNGVLQPGGAPDPAPQA
jgi:hypothetical protein